MKKPILIFLLISINTFAQQTLKSLLEKHNSGSIPYISVDSLAAILEKSSVSSYDNKKILLFDTREEKEFQISHIQDANFVGYDNFNILQTLKKHPNKETPIVVYCSLGIRSEDIGEQLKKVGYSTVFNLYGGIFEWKNQGNPVYTSNHQETNKVHTFNHEWSKWLLKGEKIND